ncbi:MAG: hypothetical protein PHO30_07345 [Candidatus Omnitrophica bacterium]|nr:hypothetical protein [Candidatus Omnitrophota bacterium]
MIEINLLPEELRVVRKTEPSQAVPVTLILLVLNAVLFSALLIVTAVNINRSFTLGALETRLKGLSGEQLKITAIRQKIANLKSTNALFSPLVSDRFLWAKKLNRLGDLVIPGVWFRSVSFEKSAPDVVVPSVKSKTPAPAAKRCLKICVSVISFSHDEMTLVGNFMRNLKTDEEFFKDFQNIELESVVRRQIAAVEIMDCTLLCMFKQEILL